MESISGYDKHICKSKVRYESRAQAKQAILKHHDHKAPYQCNVCGGWHLATHAKAKISNQKARLDRLEHMIAELRAENKSLKQENALLTDIAFDIA